MIVAVITVRVVQMAIDEIVHVVTVPDGLVAASRAVHVIRVVTGAAVFRRAALRVAVTHLEYVLIAMVAMGMVQRAIVQVVDVIAVNNSGMATLWAVGM